MYTTAVQLACVSGLKIHKMDDATKWLFGQQMFKKLMPDAPNTVLQDSSRESFIMYIPLCMLRTRSMPGVKYRTPSPGRPLPNTCYTPFCKALCTSLPYIRDRAEKHVRVRSIFGVNQKYMQFVWATNHDKRGDPRNFIYHQEPQFFIQKRSQGSRLQSVLYSLHMSMAGHYSEFISMEH